MAAFGNRNIFSIEYDIIEDWEKGDDVWVTISIFINGYDICHHKSQDYVGNCYANLYYVSEFFLENTEYIIGYDPFPLPVAGDNIVDRMNKSLDYDSDDDNEFSLWHYARDRWSFRHSWFVNRDGAVIPALYFNRNNNIMEIAYDNVFWENENVFFDEKVGIHNVDLKKFKAVVYDFMTSALIDLRERICIDSVIKKWSDYLRLWEVQIP